MKVASWCNFTLGCSERDVVLFGGGGKVMFGDARDRDIVVVQDFVEISNAFAECCVGMLEPVYILE